MNTEENNAQLPQSSVMRCLFYSLLTILFMTNSQAQYKKAEHGKTNYKKGFSYYNTSGVKCTLIRWENVGMDGYRWKTKFEQFGVSAMGWTDDRWIDLYTGKAFLNERTNQITYYDEVDIVSVVKK
jgi:hypothetical protein